MLLDLYLFVCLSVCNVGVLWPNGWMDQDETWYTDRPRPWPHCVRWGPGSPPQRGTAPNFPPICCGQMAQWIKMPLGRKVCLDPSDIVLDGDPAHLLQKGDRVPQFSAHVYCAQMAGWVKMPLGMERHCVTWGPSSPSPERGQSPQFSAHVYCG